MVGMEYPSLNDQLKCLVKKEFPEYIPVSLAEASMFDILHFCSPKSVDQSTKPNLLRRTISSLGISSSENTHEFVSLGCLFDFCPDNNEEVKTREEPICIHGQASSSQASGGMQVGMLPVGGSSSFENINNQNLGKITKSSIPYKEVIYYLKRITPENSPELFREAKKRHLYVIYEVLKAEHLKMAAVEKYNMESNVDCGGIKGNGCWNRNRDSRLSCPKSMGQFVFAYKCGQVKFKKTKRHLELVGLKEFYEGLQSRSQAETPPQSQMSSQEEEIITDYNDNIHLKAEAGTTSLAEDTNNNTM